jgi:hypothetical protein
MRTKIFFYKDVLGAETDIENGKFLNDPKGGGQLGVVVPVEEIDITPAAVEALKNAKREGGSFAPVMLTKHSDQSESKASIGLFGFGKHLFTGEDLCIGRTCDKSILELCNVADFELPEDFKEYIDSEF